MAGEEYEASNVPYGIPYSTVPYEYSGGTARGNSYEYEYEYRTVVFCLCCHVTRQADLWVSCPWVPAAIMSANSYEYHACSYEPESLKRHSVT